MIGLLAATLYATVSASFTIEQEGLPAMSPLGEQDAVYWNGDLPQRRLQVLRARHGE